MEKALAVLAGPPYEAREVSFHLPDFIDIVLNAGDARAARGATIGQSLPNWGPVANEGRGRTVAMTNFYADPDSRDVTRRARRRSSARTRWALRGRPGRPRAWARCSTRRRTTSGRRTSTRWTGAPTTGSSAVRSRARSRS